MTNILSALSVLFGLATVVSGGGALFGGVDVGNAVPFVLWFNFLAGFAYIAAGTGLYFKRPWSAWLSGAIVLATMLVGLALMIHVQAGGAYELRTVGAMSLRIVFWAFVAYHAILSFRSGKVT
jgi:hypothetical protein